MPVAPTARGAYTIIPRTAPGFRSPEKAGAARIKIVPTKINRYAHGVHEARTKLAAQTWDREVIRRAERRESSPVILMPDTASFSQVSSRTHPLRAMPADPQCRPDRKPPPGSPSYVPPTYLKMTIGLAHVPIPALSLWNCPASSAVARLVQSPERLKAGERYGTNRRQA
jgi:hypothetical protein